MAPLDKSVYQELLRSKCSDRQFEALVDFFVAAATNKNLTPAQPLVWSNRGKAQLTAERQVRSLKDRTIRFVEIRPNAEVAVVFTSAGRGTSEDIEACFYAIADMFPRIDSLLGHTFSSTWLHVQLVNEAATHSSASGLNISFRPIDHALAHVVAHELTHVYHLYPNDAYGVAPLFVVEGLANLMEVVLVGSATTVLGSNTTRLPNPNGRKLSLTLKRVEGFLSAAQEAANGLHLLQAILEGLGSSKFWAAVQESLKTQATDELALLRAFMRATDNPEALETLFVSSIDGYTRGQLMR
jgi:hypothetical protein